MTPRHYLILILIALIFSLALMAWAFAGEQWQVRDGDTIVVNGQKVRLVGYDTPETCNRPGCPEGGRPKCDAEYALGKKATVRLRELIAGARKRELEYKASRGYYGRKLAYLWLDGVWVGEVMIGEGLARSLDWEAGERRRPWCN